MGLWAVVVVVALTVWASSSVGVILREDLSNAPLIMQSINIEKSNNPYTEIR